MRINLFEYQNKVDLDNQHFEDLEKFLDEIWKNRDKNDFFPSIDTKRIESQQFLQFLHKTGQLKSNNYVGIIQYNGIKINLLPKIFYISGREYSTNDIQGINLHILWWLSYCHKIKFPNYITRLGGLKTDFFEILIYLFAKYTRKLLSAIQYRQYEDINRDLPYVKGHLNFSNYVNRHLTKGQWNKLNCDYDAFVLDNKFNRIVKYVTRLLHRQTQNFENKKILNDILFLLDEVKNEPANAEDCTKIEFNPVFKEFETVRDYCYLFLSNSVSYHYKNDLKIFAFLLPMESIFEDFVYGFIQREIPEVSIKAQSTRIFLDETKNFNLRPDLLLRFNDKHYIIDTKYKIIYQDVDDVKNGISQTDLYQMTSYAIRYKLSDILLFYPNTLSVFQEKGFIIRIKDEWASKIINISAFQIPIIDSNLMSKDMNHSSTIFQSFSYLKQNLIQRILEILGQIR